ncbi:MAG: FHA domain-containing protein, partial [Gemmatirosa sp.]
RRLRAAGAGAAVAAPPVQVAPGASAPPRDERFHDGETIRFTLPDEGTLQFLPGRLEVVGGPDRGREVRFVRTAGDDRIEVTFGRSEGPPYRHVQLMARTVSRQHAAMQLIDGHWELKNVSATNPVLLNGRPLEAGEVAPLLVEGDRIEMGEVIFCFHER